MKNDTENGAFLRKRRKHDSRKWRLPAQAAKRKAKPLTYSQYNKWLIKEQEKYRNFRGKIIDQPSGSTLRAKDDFDGVTDSRQIVALV
jgi:hypothetical protein